MNNNGFRKRNIVIILVIIIAPIILISVHDVVSLHDFSSKENIKFNGGLLSVSTDNVKYVIGAPVTVSGKILSQETKITNETHSNDTTLRNSLPVSIQVIYMPEGKLIPFSLLLSYYKTEENSSEINQVVYRSVVETSNGVYSDSGFKPLYPGNYLIGATILNGTDVNEDKVDAIAYFTVTHLLFSIPAFFLYGTIGAFGILLFLIIIDMKRDHMSEILRFVCISAIAILPIISLLFTDLEVGSSSPVGLIVHKSQNESSISQSAEWKINIGGHSESNYSTGMQIPLYVVVFGLLGSYIRYLYKTAHLKITGKELLKIKARTFKNLENKQLEKLREEHMGLTDKKIKEMEEIYGTMDKNILSKYIIVTRRRKKYIFYQSLKDVALFVLAPLLAIVVWFMLNQADITNIYVLAVVSFTVGLFTEQVIKGIREFFGTIMTSVGSRIEDETKNEDNELDEDELFRQQPKKEQGHVD